MSRKKFRLEKQPKEVVDHLFEDEILALYEQVRDGDYDRRAEVEVDPKLQQLMLSQRVGLVARNFRGSEKTTNVHDTAVVLMERLVEHEIKQTRDYNDEEIVSGFWALVQGKAPPKQRLSEQEWQERQAARKGYREAKAEKRAEKRAAGFAAQVQEERSAASDQASGRF